MYIPYRFSILSFPKIIVLHVRWCFLQALDEFYLIAFISRALETDTQVDSQWTQFNQEQPKLNIGCILNDIQYNMLLDSKTACRLPSKFIEKGYAFCKDSCVKNVG